jgi:glycosyltransferase involved in cell wall biosynthesis
VIVGVPHQRAADLEFASELRSLAESLAVADAVVFAGAVEAAAMADVYAAADVVVNPARCAESFGRVAPEALVAGRPVVASRVGGIPEAIRHDVDGLLVSADDPTALAGATIRLLEDPHLCARLVARGRERVLEKFSSERALDSWRRVIEPTLLRRRAAPS